jgi:HD-GYP domain-containing protein (c-di-GMP phosphodiesterase class II)
MSDTQVLLSKIAALRERLEQAQGLARSEPTEPIPTPPHRFAVLERQVATGEWHNTLLDTAVRPLTETPSVPTQTPSLPRQLTARARRLLEEGCELLNRMRELADEPLLQPEAGTPLAHHYRETVAMLDTALRMVQAYPEAASAQLRLCEGLEATLRVIAQRYELLTATVKQRELQAARVDALADLLAGLAAGTSLNVQPFVNLAEGIVAEAHDSTPICFYREEAANPARFVAAHSLVTAQVMARLVKHDADFRSQPLEPVMAGLIHDAAMVGIPVEVLNKRTALTDEERRTVEGHTRIGATMAAKLLPGASWLIESVAGHHERLDGTGYPAGLREMQIPPLVRLLAVCDVYAALCSPRPHRPAQEPRTALTDTLLLAEKGGLDRHFAERLLQLSFYPVGSVVELADGSVGVVVATNMSRRDLSTPARPVVALLTTPQGQPLPVPRHLDLSHGDGAAIVRTLPPAERGQLLGKHYLALA